MTGVLRASRAGLLSTRYEISDDGAVVCVWKPSAFFGGGSFALEGQRYEVARGGWTGRRYRLLDAAGALVALADGVARMRWTLQVGRERHEFERRSLVRTDQVLVRDGVPVGMVRRTSAWFGEAEAELPGLPRAAQVFVVVSLLAVWDED